MDQHVNLERLRREIGYTVAGLHKAQRRRLNRLRHELRYAALPVDQLNRALNDTARQWEQSFARLEQQLNDQGTHILSAGTSYSAFCTELTRLSTNTLHNLLDLRLTPGDGPVCGTSDRVMRLTTRAWTGIMFLVLAAAATFAGLGTLSVPLAAMLMGGAVLMRIALESVCRWRTNANRGRLSDLIAHLDLTTHQFAAELDQLPATLAHSFSPDNTAQRSAA